MTPNCSSLLIKASLLARASASVGPPLPGPAGWTWLKASRNTSILNAQCGGDEDHGPAMIDRQRFMPAGKDHGVAGDTGWAAIAAGASASGRLGAASLLAEGAGAAWPRLPSASGGLRSQGREFLHLFRRQHGLSFWSAIRPRGP